MPDRALLIWNLKICPDSSVRNPHNTVQDMSFLQVTGTISWQLMAQMLTLFMHITLMALFHLLLLQNYLLDLFFFGLIVLTVVIYCSKLWGCCSPHFHKRKLAGSKQHWLKLVSFTTNSTHSTRKKKLTSPNENSDCSLCILLKVSKTMF